MKKVLTILLSTFLIIGLCGCGKKPTEEVLTPPTNPNEITLGNDVYVLEQEETFGNISYKIDPKMVKRTYSGEYSGIPSVNFTAEDPQGAGAFAIRIFEYTNKDIDTVINDFDPDILERKDVTYNDIIYTYVKDGMEDGGYINIYVHEHNDKIYAITVTARDEVKTEPLAKIVLTNIKYN